MTADDRPETPTAVEPAEIAARRTDDLDANGVARRYLRRAIEAEDPLDRASLAAVADAAAELAVAEILADTRDAKRSSVEQLERVANALEEIVAGR